ncbi:hypothetical protein QS257_12615 [Terrilactibacillus sp. S3-3]|nr:hypothetical protein QS257_12615 [Terrilactibacillus sp. S3-3]
MLIAMVVDGEDCILPIVDGVLRIYNTETGAYKDYPNPAVGLTEGRRSAALQFAINQGATAFCTPPLTFCELSYEKARRESIAFLPLKPETTFAEFQRSWSDLAQTISDGLPAEEMAPSHSLNK